MWPLLVCKSQSAPLVPSDKASLTVRGQRVHGAIYKETIVSLKEEHLYVFSTSEVLKTIDCS